MPTKQRRYPLKAKEAKQIVEEASKKLSLDLEIIYGSKANVEVVESNVGEIYLIDGKPVLVLMLGNEEVNETKLAKALGGNVRPAHPEELKDISGADAGSIGPIGFNGKIIADYRLRDANNLYSGANKNDYHLSGIDLKRDVKTIEYFDLRSVQTGEECIKCGNKLDVFSAIELGHIFKLGTKYSSPSSKFIPATLSSTFAI